MEKEQIKMTKKLAFIMALVCGIAIASLYYIQPLEGMIATELGVEVGKMGLAPTLSQIGYALGLLCIVPLGDILERKKLILSMLVLVGTVLFLTGTISSYPLLMLMMLLIGLTSIVPQLIIPFAGQLANPAERGEILGTVTGGLLIGILLSRTFSGLVGSYYGWRAVYYSGVGLVLFLIVLVAVVFPKNIPTSKLSYKELMVSLPRLFKTQAVVRESAFNGFFIFGGFNIFWSTLIFFMESPAYQLGAKEVGYIGLVGVVGALASILMGKVSDHKGPRFGVRLGTVIEGSAFIVLALLGHQMVGLVIGVILLDLGTQSAQVSNQSRIQALGDENRSRNNTIFMFSYFVGGASGSLLGSFAWQLGGWLAVCLIGFSYCAIGLFGHRYFIKRYPANIVE